MLFILSEEDAQLVSDCVTILASWKQGIANLTEVVSLLEELELEQLQRVSVYLTSVVVAPPNVGSIELPKTSPFDELAEAIANKVIEKLKSEGKI